MKIIGVAGGSGSGKTTFARLLADKLDRSQVVILAQDSYYIDQSDHFDKDGGSVNFDHPDSIDWPLLIQHLKMLKMGAEIDMPVYDFATHTRRSETVKIKPKPFVIVDGILIFVQKNVHDQFDRKIFIKTREEIRFERRLKRDVVERGRTSEGVKAQYLAQVKPMHEQFVEPSSECADEVISGETDFTTAIATVANQLSN
jgi:uridine kinase